MTPFYFRYNSNMVHERRTLKLNRKSRVKRYNVAHDHGWPPQSTPPSQHFAFPFISLLWVNIVTLNFVDKLTKASLSILITNRPLRECGYVTWPIFSPPKTAKDREVIRPILLAAIAVTLSVLKVIPRLQAFILYLCTSWQDFDW